MSIRTAMELEYGTEAKHVSVTSEERLAAEIDRIAAEARTSTEFSPFVTLYTADDRYVAIGVGAEYSAAYWGDFGSRPRRALAARGTVNASEAMWFLYNGSPSEIPAERIIRVDEALQAMREFFRSGGERPTCLEWQAWPPALPPSRARLPYSDRAPESGAINTLLPVS